jgi:type IV fimbrial biogenesis protein FimT
MEMGKTMERNTGFTLIELMVAVALGAIILTLGVPSFQETIRNNRLATQTNDFISGLNLARSEAVKRGVRVTLCKSTDGLICTNSGGYEQGWIVFVDPNNNATVDAGEQLIRSHDAIPTSTGITLTGNSNVADYVSYTGDGMSKQTSGAFQAGTLTLCKTPKARQIILNATGRVRTTGGSC